MGIRIGDLPSKVGAPSTDDLLEIESAGTSKKIQASALLDRQNHAGTQEINTVAGLSDSLSGINESIAAFGQSAGATLIGHGTGTVADSLAALAEASDIAENRVKYQQRSIVGGELSIDASVAGSFGVDLTTSISSISLTGALAGKQYHVDVFFKQPDDVGGKTITLPPSVRVASGLSGQVSGTRGSLTAMGFVCLDGTSWLLVSQAVYASGDLVRLPIVADENATFNDEGTATTGWTTSNSTLSQSGSSLRQSKTAGGSNSSMSKAITFTPSNSDYILYGKMKARHSSGDAAVLWLLNGSKEVSLWFGSTNAGASQTLGAISICGTTGASTRNVAQVASGYNYETSSVEFALHYDQKFSTLTCWFREADGRWKWVGRVACDWFSSTQIQALTSTPSAAGAWIEFDYLTLARPNLAVLSDSVGEGKTLFSPNPALGLTNDESTWMRHAPIYQAMRNNLIVNKGVGSNTSAQLLARVSDVTGAGVRVVFLSASSNDEVAGVSQAARTSNIQGTVNAINSASGQVVLLNAMYGTSAGADNQPTPDLRDYMRTWWTDSLGSVTGVAVSIDVMAPLIDGGFMKASYTQSDGIHPNITGQALVGGLIASYA